MACGGDVRGWRVGDPVCALTPGGGYAEYCTTPAGYCLPLPEGWTAHEAASLPDPPQVLAGGRTAAIWA